MKKQDASSYIKIMIINQKSDVKSEESNLGKTSDITKFPNNTISYYLGILLLLLV